MLYFNWEEFRLTEKDIGLSSSLIFYCKTTLTAFGEASLVKNSTAFSSSLRQFSFVKLTKAFFAS